MSILLSESAAREITKIMEESELDPSRVRLSVGVKGGGCSGFKYKLDLQEIEEGQEDDGSYEQFETHGIQIICDPKSYLYLNGCTVDFCDEIGGRGFTFENPNSSGTCGCGSSFSA